MELASITKSYAYTSPLKRSSKAVKMFNHSILPLFFPKYFDLLDQERSYSKEKKIEEYLPVVSPHTHVVDLNPEAPTTDPFIFRCDNADRVEFGRFELDTTIKYYRGVPGIEQYIENLKVAKFYSMLKNNSTVMITFPGASVLYNDEVVMANEAQRETVLKNAKHFLELVLDLSLPSLELGVHALASQGIFFLDSEILPQKLFPQFNQHVLKSRTLNMDAGFFTTRFRQGFGVLVPFNEKELETEELKKLLRSISNTVLISQLRTEFSLL